ncbi:unnamed protein product [Brassica oleracea]|uniref:(rape) hypothetical protein n=1 Tax=Brassica napus TaxID=3708 RepID=A0A816RVL4_BRANA|nr:unnamed protein product [Brassica napus]
MSIVTAYTPFTKLDLSKTQHTSSGGDSFEMVLADQWGNKIHASCKPSLMYRVQRVLPIDKWGVVQNVSVTAAGGQYRTSQHKYRMTIADDAVLSGSGLADERHLLSLAKYEEIQNGTLNQISS